MDKTLERKFIKKTKQAAYILQTIPFVEAVVLNGSLAQKKAKVSSDIDILIIAQDKRIWLTRFFVNAIFALVGQKRAKNESKNHTRKFCFNYFLTTNFLKIPTGREDKVDLYCADNYSQSVLLWGDEMLFQRFLDENRILFQKAKKSYPNRQFEDTFPINTIKLFGFTKRLKEKFLSNKIGDYLELRTKIYQLKKINLDLRTKDYPTFIVCNDRELRFHPPKEQKRIVN